MKISVQTHGAIDRLGIDGGMAAIAAAGFAAVDFGFETGISYEEMLACKESENYKDENIYPYLDEVKAAAEKYGLEIGQAHAPAPAYVKVSEEATEMMQGYIRKSIALCEYIGCKRLIIHPVFDGSARFPKFTKEEEHTVNIEFYSSLIPLLKKHGVICCLENMWIQDWKSKKIYVGTCSEINETIRYIDELNEIAGERLFGFCLDIGHLLLLGQDPCYWIEKLGARLETLHTHDNDGVGDDHTLPYLGCGNWERFILGLRKIGYSGNMNFETSPFNNSFPKELVPSALAMIGAVGKYFAARVTAESDETDEYR